MLFSQKMNEALNEQIGNEFNSSLQYVAIASYFDAESLPELASHYYRQSEEERAHAMRIVKYVIDAGGTVRIPAVQGHNSDFSSPETAVRAAYDGEMTITQQINGLMDHSLKETDHITANFLQWFVTEQLEEVSSAETLLKIVQRAGNDLLHVEEYLARRQSLTAAAPAVGQAGT
jgi:ferritin